MKTYTLERSQYIDLPVEEVFAFFKKPENLETITPNEIGFKILTPSPIKMQTGAILDYTIKILFFHVRWTTVITDYEELKSFSDVALKSPYSFWHHTHRFETKGSGTMMYDNVDYVMPFGIIGRIAHAFWVKNQLKNIFDFRADIISSIFEETLQKQMEA